MDHRVGAAHRVAQPARVAEVGERELDPDPVRPEPLRIADQAAHLVALGEQLRSSAEPTTPVAPVSRITACNPTHPDLGIGRPPRPLQSAALATARPRPRSQRTKETHLGLRHRRTLHRREGQLLRRGLPGRLHPSDPRRARLRGRRSSSSSIPTSASTAMPASRPAPSTPASPRTSFPTSGPSTPRSTPSTSPASRRRLGRGSRCERSSSSSRGRRSSSAAAGSGARSGES